MSDPRRPGIVPLSITVHLSLATRLAHHVREGGSLLAIEVRFEPVPDGFVQQDSRPPGTEHHFHFACWRVARVELDDGLRAASIAKCSGVFSVWKNSIPTRPPPPEFRAQLAAVLAMQNTLIRANGCESSSRLPSEPMTRMRRNSSA